MNRRGFWNLGHEIGLVKMKILVGEQLWPEIKLDEERDQIAKTRQFLKWKWPLLYSNDSKIGDENCQRDAKRIIKEIRKFYETGPMVGIWGGSPKQEDGLDRFTTFNKNLAVKSIEDVLEKQGEPSKETDGTESE